jgi:hypothetical protein
MNSNTTCDDCERELLEFGGFLSAMSCLIRPCRHLAPIFNGKDPRFDCSWVGLLICHPPVTEFGTLATSLTSQA